MRYILHPQTGYPFTLSLEVVYSLDERGLTVEMRAENVGAESILEQAIKRLKRSN